MIVATAVMKGVVNFARAPRMIGMADPSRVYLRPMMVNKTT
jgi:hypothetical protein